MLPYNQDSHTAATTRNNPAHLDDAIKCTQDFLLSQQFPDGYWWAELECNATIAAETILLFSILSITHKYPLHKMEKLIRRLQRSDGAWELFYEDGGDLNVTIEAYMALRLLGAPRSDLALLKAHNFIISKGGITQARIFTKLHLALLGCYDWSALPSMPPWVVLVPSWFVSSIYELSSWARSAVMPLIVVFDKKPVFRVTPELSFDELYAEGRKYAPAAMPLRGDLADIFLVVDRFLKAVEGWGLVPFRGRATKFAEKWVLERQEDTGDWGGIFQAMFYSMLCLKVLGYKVTDPVLHRGLLALKNFCIETEDEYRVQTSVTPVWDTALILQSLLESGIALEHPALQKAGEWLLNKQITQPGDWSVKNNSGCTGGWAFEFNNKWYPDVDDSAAVVMALDRLRLADEDVKYGAMARAVEWISSMQCKAGGWAAFDKDNNQDWLSLTPFGDLKAMTDPNTADATARVLEMVGRLKLRDVNHMCNAAFPPPVRIQKALAFLRKEQKREGCWFGRWGVNYIYGTCGALMALSLIAPSTHRDEITRGARWLVQVQNMKDESSEGYGGWGETCYSYNDPSLKGKGVAISTPTQTAWALMGLLAAGDVLGRYEVDAIEHGIRYLLCAQRQDGSWHEVNYTGTGFPRSIYLRYHYYAQHFPLTALARYRAKQHKILSQQRCPAASC